MRTKFINILKDYEKQTNEYIQVSIQAQFTEMILSWNLCLGIDQTLDIEVQFRGNLGWSEPLKWAHWTKDNKKHSYARQSCVYGTLDVDVFTANKAYTIDGIRIYLRDSHGISNNFENLRGLYASFLYNHARSFNTDLSKLRACYVPTPVYVQYPVPQIGRRICSPVTCSMLMGSFGVLVNPEKLAEFVYDSRSDLYGNWSFNMAGVSQYGFKAIVKYFESVIEVQEYINKGLAVGVSIRTPKEIIIEGALQAYPSGHLIVVTGLVQRDGEWFVIVNDPADDYTKSAQRMYALKDFEKYWSGVGYVIEEDAELKEINRSQMDQILNWIPDIHIDLKYKSKDNLMKDVIYNLPEHEYSRLRVGTLQKLAKAQFIIKQKGLSIKVWDAFRTINAQKKLWSLKPDERFVAHPSKGSKHNRGCAVDVTLCDLEGRNLKMPTAFDDFTSKARSFRRDWSPDVMKHISLLQMAFITAGFATIPDEWWHFDDCDWELYTIL